jgi:hypothetical protein
MYRIGLVMNVMRSRKCGALEAIAWLSHIPSDGDFKFNPQKPQQDEKENFSGHGH